MNERFGFYPEKLLGAPVVVCGELLEGNVALKVLGAVALRPRQTTGRLKRQNFLFEKVRVLYYLGVNQVRKAGGLDGGPLGGGIPG